jgi:hypothetical protein
MMMALAKVSGSEMVATSILHIYYLDVGISFFDSVDKPITAVNSGAAGLVMNDDRNFTFTADELCHFVGSQSGGGNVVGSGSGRGMSLSTPESKPMTGILAAWACSKRGITALLSKAANRGHLGFCLELQCSISICLSTWDSLSGPSKVISTPNSQLLVLHQALLPARIDAGTPWISLVCRFLLGMA